jgi:hypothetical protein
MLIGFIAARSASEGMETSTLARVAGSDETFVTFGTPAEESHLFDDRTCLNPLERKDVGRFPLKIQSIWLWSAPLGVPHAFSAGADYDEIPSRAIGAALR